MTDYGPQGGKFTWLGEGLVQLHLKFGEQLPDCPAHRFVHEKSLKWSPGKNSPCSDRLAASLLAYSNILQKTECKTTASVPQVKLFSLIRILGLVRF